MKKMKIAALARALFAPVRTKPMTYDEPSPSTRRAPRDGRSFMVEFEDDGPLTIRP